MRFFVAGLVLLSACHRGGPPDAGVIDPEVEASKLAAFLPSPLGPLTAKGAALPSASGMRIDAWRSYSDASGHEVSIRLMTGDLGSMLPNLDSDDEHAFLSDTPTYWRTTAIAGHRTRIGEERPAPKTSTCEVRVGPNHVAEVRVVPATTAGECATDAALLDFAAIVASGGVAFSSPRR